MMARALLFVLILLQCSLSFAQDSAVNVELYFRFGKTELEDNFKSNAASLIQLEDLLSDDEFMNRLDKVTIQGIATPEGGHQELNIAIAHKRAKAIENYFKTNYPTILPFIERSTMPENWELFSQMVNQSTQLKYKQKVLDIIDASIGVDTKRWRLKQIDNGKEWERLNLWIFPNMRIGAIVSFHLGGEIVEVQSLSRPNIEDMPDIIEATPVVEDPEN